MKLRQPSWLPAFGIVLAMSCLATAPVAATSGMVRFFGSWDLAGRESGNTTQLKCPALGFRLTHVNEEYPQAPNRYRIAGPYVDVSFGLVEIDWQAEGAPSSSWPPSTSRDGRFSSTASPSLLSSDEAPRLP